MSGCGAAVEVPLFCELRTDELREKRLIVFDIEGDMAKKEEHD